MPTRRRWSRRTVARMLMAAVWLAVGWSWALHAAPPDDSAAEPQANSDQGEPAAKGLAAAPSAGRPSAAAPREAQWIWSPAFDPEHNVAGDRDKIPPAGVCFFRRSFDMAQPEAGEVQIACDEAYELFVNGRPVGAGKNWHVMDIHDITHFLVPGRNTIAVRAVKNAPGPAGLAVRVLVKNAGDTYVAYLSNEAWKTSEKEFVGWTQPRFNETQWLPARAIGPFGIVKPWLDESQIAGGKLGGRFKIAEEFRVDAVASPQETGSLIAMAFDEFGDILASRENGPLLILRGQTSSGHFTNTSVYCDEVKNIQGILPLNGRVFVVGEGPQGAGLYRISDPEEAPIKREPGDRQQPPAAGKPARRGAEPNRLPGANRETDSAARPDTGNDSRPDAHHAFYDDYDAGAMPANDPKQATRPHRASPASFDDEADVSKTPAPQTPSASADGNELKPIGGLDRPPKAPAAEAAAEAPPADGQKQPHAKQEQPKSEPPKPAIGAKRRVELLIKFAGGMSEHGPHAPVLGPDGLIYVLLGDHAKPEPADDPGSPYHHAYEGDLVTPRYEDPNGYGVGVKAPGGRIIRTDIDGSFVETFAAGFRNPYDFVFTRAGELITHDSDMEWDVGMPWYRPTRVLHVVPGGEYGWRSGWAAWPTYFFDSVPSIGDTGRGSPTGMVAYNHVMFPRRLHGTLFVGDWARGRILNIRLKPVGASFTAETSVFLEGKPLNVTYLAIGPDGALYFCTGGRDTEGGIYRVAWKGTVPDNMLHLGEGLEAALRQPQIDAAWARQRLATLREQLGPAWDKELPEVADDKNSGPNIRCRALDLMQLLGPFPTKSQLIHLSGDTNEQIRVKATFLMGIHADEKTGARLIELLRDGSPTVQRTACEALVRAGQKASWIDLAPALDSPDRYVAYAATRALEQVPKQSWQATALAAKKPRVFLQSALALLTMDPDRATVEAILARVDRLMAGYVSDLDFLDLLRVTELALERGKIGPDEVPKLHKRMVAEYPAKDRLMNRELLRLLAWLHEPAANEQIIGQLQNPDLPPEEKLHLALLARFIPDWTTPQKLTLLKYYETARTLPGGHSFTGYIESVSRDFFAELTEEERAQVLADGAKWPSSALSVLAKLPDDPGPETLGQLQVLDRQLDGLSGEPVRRLRIGLVAVLGHSGNADAAAYLRDLWDRDPERRGYIAMALAEHPEGKNWDVLVRSLPIVEGVFAQQVLVKLASVDRKPEGPEPVRQAILRGLKLGDNGGKLAVVLLQKWTGQTPSQPGDSWQTALAAWQRWFAETYPDQPEAKLPVDSNANRWTFDELLSYLDSPDAAAANPQRGAEVFAKAQCIKCHRFGERGESVGPDLTSVSRRFQKKEILELILFPSQVISDQYASKLVELKDGRSVWGIVSPQPDGSLSVLQSDAVKVLVPKDQIDEVRPLKKSAMPEGLMNTLTLEEIGDLFAYLGQSPDAKITSRRTQAER